MAKTTKSKNGVGTPDIVQKGIRWAIGLGEKHIFEYRRDSAGTIQKVTVTTVID